MQINFAAYADKKICVAVSGGKDSVALLHLLCQNRKGYNISVCAVNCDHGLRPESADECAFVKRLCEEWGVPVIQFKEDCNALANRRGVSVETAARDWRKICYFNACKHFNADAVATAHHLNDNAETVLFNLARGTSLAGMAGIRDGRLTVALKGGKAVYPEEGGQTASVQIVRPLICCSRAEIDAYIGSNALGYVTDTSNFCNDYTRNFIRNEVLPLFERIAPAAVNAVGRFSELAAEDERFFAEYIEREHIVEYSEKVSIKFCPYRSVFKRAAISALKYLNPQVKDYTGGQAERLYNLQFCESGKRFEFLGFAAYKEGENVVLCRAEKRENAAYSAPFWDYAEQGATDFCGEKLKVMPYAEDISGGKTLKFDMDKIPQSAEIRFMRTGDRFTKFGGGTKNLGDYFTDKKIPKRVRASVPLVADGGKILIICGVEISDGVKVTNESKRIGAVICADYADK